ncbi:MAG: cytochrome C oxidase subunit IV family protein [SAR324 cluster bacterium]|nr:cytochrome C oxidase subunit IV family protein [SAR324 cluster bacterium]
MTAESHGHTNYVKIWGILLFLLVVSVVGPMLEIPVLTLITAFGIAIVKALMVAAYFMHLNIEKRYVWYMLISGLVALLVLFVGLSSDIMTDTGKNWEDCIATSSCVEQRL